MENLRPSFLGAITEVCFVTANHMKTMDGLLRLGIGPFQVFDFTPETVPERYIRGRAGSFELKVCFAKQGDLTFEIMQPTAGESLMAEYLDQVLTSILLVPFLLIEHALMRSKETWSRRHPAHCLRLQEHPHGRAQKGDARKGIQTCYGRHLERQERDVQVLLLRYGSEYGDCVRKYRVFE